MSTTTSSRYRRGAEPYDSPSSTSVSRSSSQASAESSVSSAQSLDHATHVRAEDPTAIGGLACRLPGATSPSTLWENVVKQKDLQSKIPADRFNVDAFYNPVGAHKGTVRFRHSEAGDSTDCHRPMPPKDTFWTRISVYLTRNSFTSRVKKPRQWIPSSVSCSRSSMRRLRPVRSPTRTWDRN